MPDLTPEEFDSLRRLFIEARALAPELRSGFVEAETTSGSRVRRELRALLAAADRPHRFLSGEALDGEAS